MRTAIDDVKVFDQRTRLTLRHVFAENTSYIGSSEPFTIYANMIKEKAHPEARVH